MSKKKQNIYKEKINGLMYLVKYDKQTNKKMYKKKFTISINGKKISKQTKEWQTSTTKVNKDVERERFYYQDNKIKCKNNKHLYSDIVKEYYDIEVQNCINHNSSFEIIEKFLSNNNNYVLNGNYPNFENRYVEDLTIFDIKQLKKDINSEALKKGLSRLTVGHIFTNIDRALKYCSEMMYIDDSIIDNIRISPKGKKRNQTSIKNFLLKNEYDYLMKVFEKDFKFCKSETPKQTEFRKKLYQTYFTCAFLLGFRKGEGFGLTWKDFDNNKIYINTTLNTKNVKKHYKNKTSRLINPKTNNSIREMKAPKSVRDCLNNWKEYCNSLNIPTSEDDFVFIELNNSCLNPTTFRNRFNKIIEVSNVQEKYNKHLYIHGFRHSCCSFLVQKLREADNDISLREIEISVGRYLGHSNGNMVKEVYMHLYPESDTSLLNTLLDEI